MLITCMDHEHNTQCVLNCTKLYLLTHKTDRPRQCQTTCSCDEHVQYSVNSATRRVFMNDECFMTVIVGM